MSRIRSKEECQRSCRHTRKRHAFSAQSGARMSLLKRITGPARRYRSRSLCDWTVRLRTR